MPKPDGATFAQDLDSLHALLRARGRGWIERSITYIEETEDGGTGAGNGRRSRRLGRIRTGVEVNNARKGKRGGRGGKRSTETRARMIIARVKGLPKNADRDALAKGLSPHVAKWATLSPEDRKNLIAGLGSRRAKKGGRGERAAPALPAGGNEGSGG